jgi:hypothetical protein
MELKDTEVHIGAPSLSLTRFINIDDEKTHEYSLCWEMEPCGWLRRWLIENDLLDACVIRYFDRLPLVGGKKNICRLKSSSFREVGTQYCSNLLV